MAKLNADKSATVSSAASCVIRFTFPLLGQTNIFLRDHNYFGKYTNSTKNDYQQVYLV